MVSRLSLIAAVALTSSFVNCFQTQTISSFPQSCLSKFTPSSIHSSKQTSKSALCLNTAAASLIAVPTLYCLMSINEYITHRYYQHTEFNKNSILQVIARFFNLPTKIKGGGHVEHHAETYDDMTLKTDDAWRRTPAAKSLDNDVYRGTAFNWEVTMLMALQMIPTTVPVFTLLLGFSFLKTIAFIVPAILLHALIWNSLHPHMHGLPEVPFFAGPPSQLLSIFRTSAYFKYLYQNHEGHHVVGGIGNYNVCCPFTDHLLGTYIKESEWRPRQLVNIDILSKKRAIVDSTLLGIRSDSLLPTETPALIQATM